MLQKVPILFIIFNRKDIALNSFKNIRQYKPDKLYIAGDGSRINRNGEKQLCEECRREILNQIDWKCKIYTLFREENMGVDKNIYHAINWFFENEKWGIIIEDDCSVSVEFFKYCEVAFPKYDDAEIVKQIGAYNPIFSGKSTNISVFSYFPETWGWGTWKRAWLNDMDVTMTDWKKYSLLNSINDNGIILGLFFYKYWKYSFKYKEDIKTWDCIWQFSIMHKRGLCLRPQTNLALNTGIGTSEGSHFNFGDIDPYSEIILGRLNSPYNFPINYEVGNKQIDIDKQKFIYTRLFNFKNKTLKQLKLWKKK